MTIDLINITLLTLAGGLFSLIGSAYLTAKKWWNETVSLKFVSFAAGVMISAALLDLLPEAFEDAFSTDFVFYALLFGILFMFFMERSLLIFHHHHEDSHSIEPSVYLIMVGDTFHNFMDGVSIAVAYMVSPILGLTTTFAVAAHEVPQEISEFAVTVSRGYSRKRALLMHSVSSVACVFGGVLTYFFFSQIEPYIYLILAFTAGAFLYIACADLIPGLHEEYKKESGWMQSATFLLGIFVVALLRFILES